MYEFDLGVLNSERAYITNTLTISDTTDDSTATETSDFKQYEKAITVTDTYHETKTRFAWVGEVQNERLHTGLEKLSDEDLKLLTLYAVSGFNEYEIAKVFRLSQPAIHKRIAKITLFLKKFWFLVIFWAFSMARKCKGNSPDGESRWTKCLHSCSLKTE